MKCLVCSLDNCQEQECADTLRAIQALLDAMPSCSEIRVTIPMRKLIEPQDLIDVQEPKLGTDC